MLRGHQENSVDNKMVACLRYKTLSVTLAPLPRAYAEAALDALTLAIGAARKSSGRRKSSSAERHSSKESVDCEWQPA
jgi:hypothetical protein